MSTTKTMRRIYLLPRILAALLSLSLALPNPAYALRQLNAGAEENPPLTRQLTNALSRPTPEQPSRLAGAEELMKGRFSERGVLGGAEFSNRRLQQSTPKLKQRIPLHIETTNLVPSPSSPHLALEHQSDRNQRYIQPRTNDESLDLKTLSQDASQYKPSQHRVTGVDEDLQQRVPLLGSEFKHNQSSVNKSIILSGLGQSIPAAGAEEFHSLDQFLTLSGEHRVYMFPDLLFGMIYNTSFGGISPRAMMVSPGDLWKPISSEDVQRIRQELRYARNPRRFSDGSNKQNNPLLAQTALFLDQAAPEAIASWVNEIFGRPGNLLFSIPRFSIPRTDLEGGDSSIKGKEYLLSEWHRLDLMRTLRHELGHRHLLGHKRAFLEAYRVLIEMPEDSRLFRWSEENTLRKLRGFLRGSSENAEGDSMEFWARLLEPLVLDLDRETIDEFIRRLRQSGRQELQVAADIYERARLDLESDFKNVWPKVGGAFVDRILSVGESRWSRFVPRWILRRSWEEEASVIRRRWTSLEETSPAAGAEEVKFYDGFTEQRTGNIATGLEELVQKREIRPGEHRAVVTLPAATDLGITRIFIHSDLLLRNFPGVQGIPLPKDPAQAAQFLRDARVSDTDLILLPLTVAPGSEASYRPAGSKTPIVVIPASSLEEANSQVLAALALIAKNLKDQVLRVGLEEWTHRVWDRDRNNLSIQY